MESFGNIIRRLREEKKLPLHTVADFLNIDQAVLSKIERSQRRPSREQVIKLAGYFNTGENELLVAWLSDKLVYELNDEEVALEALQVAEEKVAYVAFKKTDRKVTIKELIAAIKNFPAIEKAWVYGSFARGDDGPKSDIDIALQTSSTFSYFDLADVQFKLEQRVNRKVDVGFITAFKPYIFEHVKQDLQLIYERPS